MFFLYFSVFFSTVGFKSYGILERHENILCGDTVMKLFSINNRRKNLFPELRRYHQESEREKKKEKEERETMEQVLILIMW